MAGKQSGEFSSKITSLSPGGTGGALYEAGVLFSSIMGKYSARMLNKSRSGCV
jgi:hypothetical protein